jgi:hypothetical protein
MSDIREGKLMAFVNILLGADKHELSADPDASPP